MKKVKKTIPKIMEVMTLHYEIQCPHCYTFLRGGFNENTIRYKCDQCEKLIEIEWDKAISLKDF